MVTLIQMTSYSTKPGFQLDSLVLDTINETKNAVMETYVAVIYVNK